MGGVRRGELDTAAATVHGALEIARGLADGLEEAGRARVYMVVFGWEGSNGIEE